MHCLCHLIPKIGRLDESTEKRKRNERMHRKICEEKRGLTWLTNDKAEMTEVGYTEDTVENSDLPCMSHNTQKKALVQVGGLKMRFVSI